MSSTTSVVVSVGTDHHPFDRLMGWLERWAAQHPDVDVLVQRGTSRPPRGVDSVELLPRTELTERMAAADVVVVQGGPGGIIDSLRVGVCPIVVPRRHDLGEHIDDHQVAFARHMALEGEVLIAEDERTLVSLLDDVLRDPDRMRMPPRMTDRTDTATLVATLVGDLIASTDMRRFRWWRRRPTSPTPAAVGKAGGSEV